MTFSFVIKGFNRSPGLEFYMNNRSGKLDLNAVIAINSVTWMTPKYRCYPTYSGSRILRIYLILIVGHIRQALLLSEFELKLAIRNHCR